ncbi:MAG: hypothetical protein HUJ54_07485 [Erysipelotrichaceae bacterium]|nr:hypothetical protein [Erysipelotrichaceae bacterium]
MKNTVKKLARKVVAALTGSDFHQTSPVIFEIPSLPDLLYGNDSCHYYADLYKY